MKIVRYNNEVRVTFGTSVEAKDFEVKLRKVGEDLKRRIAQLEKEHSAAIRKRRRDLKNSLWAEHR